MGEQRMSIPYVAVACGQEAFGARDTTLKTLSGVLEARVGAHIFAPANTGDLSRT